MIVDEVVLKVCEAFDACTSVDRTRKTVTLAGKLILPVLSVAKLVGV